MKQKTITLYSFDELSKEAQKKAHNEWIKHNDYYFLEANMAEWLHELLAENSITDHNDTSQPGTKPTPVLYSLSYCQGDGCMFEGQFTWKGLSVNIKHSGRYYHAYSCEIDMPEASEREYTDFAKIYVKICKELEHRGYDFIEHEDSLESFKEACEANDYTFTSDGIMEN